MKRTSISALVLIVAGAFSSSAAAAVVQATANETGSGSSHTPSAAFQPSSVDLINGLAPAAQSGNFFVEVSDGPVRLTDGVFQTIGFPGGTTHPAFAAGGPTGGTSITYTLPASPLGYDLSTIVTYGGWNDSGRDEQNYTVLYSTNANPTLFIPLTSVQFNPSIGGGVESATRVTLTDTTGVLASGVHSLRFDFGLTTENGHTGYAEIDVFGSNTVAPIPEPSSAALVGLSALALFPLRRRGRRE